MKKKTLLWILFFFILLLILTVSLSVKESFENLDDEITKEINSVITLFNDSFCPAYNVLLEDKMIEMDGTEEQKMIAAHAQLEKDAGGALFPCPPPADPVQLPATIAKQVERSIQFFEKRLEEMKTNLLEQMNQCGSSPAEVEGFATPNVCAPPLGKTRSPPPPPKPSTCLDVSDLSPDQRSAILKARLETLSTLARKPGVADSLANIQAITQELLDTKKKAEAGELRPNCPQ
jgi:hypothetical protein